MSTGPDADALRIHSGPSLREQVSAKLRESIGTGLLKPGTRLIERDLCERMGVSRTSIRESFRELESEGLVTMVPNRGPIVAMIDIELAESIFQARGALEALAVKLFTQRASDDEVAALDAATRALDEPYRNPEPFLVLSAKNQFYELLLKGARNEVVATFLRNMHLRISQLRATSLKQPHRSEQSIAEIREMVAAIKKRDATLAHDLCLTHIENASKAAMNALRDELEGSHSAA